MMTQFGLLSSLKEILTSANYKHMTIVAYLVNSQSNCSRAAGNHAQLASNLCHQLSLPKAFGMHMVVLSYSGHLTF